MTVAAVVAAYAPRPDRLGRAAPFVGGGFGAGLRVWPHVVLAVLAAREVRRPVKLVLTRPEMITSVGHRPDSVQRIKIGATRAGDLVAIEHHGTSSAAMEDADYEPVSHGSAVSYACPNVLTRDRHRHRHVHRDDPTRR
ncbi:molybdopterin cofactor-binding domain-containing protein [Streptomyces sp. NPDC047315]|uniref:molybdopterin cofactor-binding domain-containing protein n=1 Tax=Streptomyces sp. NPDC047315 TaxID=3155142 RepID=UPI0033D6B765